MGKTRNLKPLHKCTQPTSFDVLHQVVSTLCYWSAILSHARLCFVVPACPCANAPLDYSMAQFYGWIRTSKKQSTRVSKPATPKKGKRIEADSNDKDTKDAVQ